MQSPEFNLDQTPSYEAINVMQNFINQYPTSEFAKNAGGIVNELELKLEKKEIQVLIYRGGLAGGSPAIDSKSYMITDPKVGLFFRE